MICDMQIMTEFFLIETVILEVTVYYNNYSIIYIEN